LAIAVRAQIRGHEAAVNQRRCFESLAVIIVAELIAG